MLEKGQSAPEFELLDEKEHAVQLTDFRSQHLVLYFFPKADTPG